MFSRDQNHRYMNPGVVLGTIQRSMIIHWDSKASTFIRLHEAWMPFQFLTGRNLKVVSYICRKRTKECGTSSKSKKFPLLSPVFIPSDLPKPRMAGIA